VLARANSILLDWTSQPVVQETYDLYIETDPSPPEGEAPLLNKRTKRDLNPRMTVLARTSSGLEACNLIPLDSGLYVSFRQDVSSHLRTRHSDSLAPCGPRVSMGC
jgi:hypothetical protein